MQKATETNEDQMKRMDTSSKTLSAGKSNETLATAKSAHKDSIHTNDTISSSPSHSSNSLTAMIKDRGDDLMEISTRTMNDNDDLLAAATAATASARNITSSKSNNSLTNEVGVNSNAVGEKALEEMADDKEMKTSTAAVPASTTAPTSQRSAQNIIGDDVRVKHEDMNEKLREDVIEIAKKALMKTSTINQELNKNGKGNKSKSEKDIAAQIKTELDKIHGPTWHVIVGRSFGSYVTHQTGHIIYFYIGHMAFLVFKS